MGGGRFRQSNLFLSIVARPFLDRNKFLFCFGSFILEFIFCLIKGILYKSELRPEKGEIRNDIKPNYLSNSDWRNLGKLIIKFFYEDLRRRNRLS